MAKRRFDPRGRSFSTASGAWAARGVATAIVAWTLGMAACDGVAEVRQAWNGRRAQFASTLDGIKRQRSQLAESMARPVGPMTDQPPGVGARRHRVAAALKGLEQSLNDVEVRLTTSERTIEAALARGAGEARATMDTASESISQDIAGLQTNVAEIERELRNET